MAPAAPPAAPRGPARGGRWEEIYRRSLDCVHCGLCLPVCPTYRETGREISSPRGRIYLMRSIAEGRLPAGAGLAGEAYLCLGCRACETACPSGVRFGSMLELARAEVEEGGLRGGLGVRLERWGLRGLVPHRRRLRLAVDLLAIAQRLGLEALARALAPASWRDALALAPAVPPRRARRRLPERIPAEGERRGCVALLEGCIAAEIFAPANAATARMLARNGFDVLVPRSQGCCGALHAHAGQEDTAHELARRNVAAFGPLVGEVDAVITNSAGCGAALRELDTWLPGEGGALAEGVRDVCEFLDAAGLRPPPGRVEARVCYDDPCHLVHGQRVSRAPRRLLRQIEGLTLVDHDDPTSCCGAAGIYNLTHPAMSRAVLARKMEALAAVDPDAIASGNPGCLMQLASGARRAGLRARVVHPIELLDEAYR